MAAQLASRTPLVLSNTQFGLDMLRTLSKDMKADDNMFFSPFSISTALAMTSLGARGKSETEMKQSLRFGSLADEDLHASFCQLLQDVNAPGKPYTLKTANRLYAKLGYNFVKKFLDETSKHYGAEAKVVDFAGDADGVKWEINAWVEEQTANKIRDLVQQIDPRLVLILINAIYFKGNWKDKFDPHMTEKNAFHVSKTETVQTDFMYQNEKIWYGYSDRLKCSIIDLPYENDELSFCAFVPSEIDGLAKLEETITAEDLCAENFYNQHMLNKQEIHLYMPKFKLEQSIDLNEQLQKLGMKEPFIEGAADFSGMDGSQNLFISKVVHKAFIEVNEEGSEAAAATVVMMNFGCSMAVEMIQIRLDRPSLFLIRHNGSGSVLFLGRYSRPQQA